MADMLADNLVRKIIGEIIIHKNTLPDDALIWKQLTKCMIRNFGIGFVINQIDEIVGELADKDWFENKYPPHIFKESKRDFKKRKSVIKIDLRRATLRKAINDNLKITQVAESYGIKVKNGKALCPFHDDKEPSLSLSDEKNIFHCFGCGAKGNLIEFIRRYENGKMLEM